MALKTRMGLISVVVPCKDRIDRDTRHSIVSQTYREIEVIKTAGIDVQKNRNKGAIMAEGEFLFFCDNDVILKENIFQKMVDILNAYENIGYVYCDFEKKGGLIGIQKGMPFNDVCLKQCNYISTMSMMRRSIFPGFDESVKRFQDWDLWLTLLEKGIRGMYIPEVLFTANYAPGGISLQPNIGESTEIVMLKHKLGRFKWNL